jgi:hypothetical protein
MSYRFRVALLVERTSVYTETNPELEFPERRQSGLLMTRSNPRRSWHGGQIDVVNKHNDTAGLNAGRGLAKGLA